MKDTTYLMFGGSYGVGGAKPIAGITALAADTPEAAEAEADAIMLDAHVGFKGIWSGGYDLYELAGRRIRAGPIVDSCTASLDDLPAGARMIMRRHLGRSDSDLV